MRCSFLECWSTPDKNVTFIKSVHSWLEHQLSIIFIRNLGWNYNPAELTQNFIKETQGIKIWELNLAHSVIVLVRTWACDLMFWNFQGFHVSKWHSNRPLYPTPNTQTQFLLRKFGDYNQENKTRYLQKLLDSTIDQICPFYISQMKWQDDRKETGAEVHRKSFISYSQTNWWLETARSTIILPTQLTPYL